VRLPPRGRDQPRRRCGRKPTRHRTSSEALGRRTTAMSHLRTPAPSSFPRVRAPLFEESVPDSPVPPTSSAPRQGPVDEASKWRQDRVVPRSRRKSGPAESAAQAAPQCEGDSTQCRTPAPRNSALRHRPRRRLRWGRTPPGLPGEGTANRVFPPTAEYADHSAEYVGRASDRRNCGAATSLQPSRSG